MSDKDIDKIYPEPPDHNFDDLLEEPVENRSQFQESLEEYTALELLDLWRYHYSDGRPGASDFDKDVCMKVECFIQDKLNKEKKCETD